MWILTLTMVAMAIVLSTTVNTDPDDKKQKDGSFSSYVRYVLFTGSEGTITNWPKARSAWLKKNIIPVLVYVGERDDTIPHEVRFFEPIDGMDDTVVSELVRIMYPTMLPGMTIIASLDSKPVDANCVEHMNADNVGITSKPHDVGRLALDYVVAQQDVWCEMSPFTIREMRNKISSLKHNEDACEVLCEMVQSYGKEYLFQVQ